MKKCFRCKLFKNTSEFDKNNGNRDSLKSWCKSCMKEYNEIYTKTENGKIAIKKYEHSKKRKEQKRIYQKSYSYKHKKEKLKKDPIFKLIEGLRNRIWHALKNNIKSKKTLELLGCTPEKAKQHLESKFTEGMTWKNHGMFGWHVDHVIPCASFDLSKSEEQRRCFHYSNLQPLWAGDNLKKSYKIKHLAKLL